MASSWSPSTAYEVYNNFYTNNEPNVLGMNSAPPYRPILFRNSRVLEPNLETLYLVQHPYIHLVLRGSETRAGDAYFAKLMLQTSAGTSAVRITRVVNGQEAILASMGCIQSPFNSCPAGREYFWVRFSANGNDMASGVELKLKIWPEGTEEPSDFILTATDVASKAILASGYTGISNLNNFPFRVAVSGWGSVGTVTCNSTPPSALPPPLIAPSPSVAITSPPPSPVPLVPPYPSPPSPILCPVPRTDPLHGRPPASQNIALQGWVDASSVAAGNSLSAANDGTCATVFYTNGRPMQSIFMMWSSPGICFKQVWLTLHQDTPGDINVGFSYNHGTQVHSWAERAETGTVLAVAASQALCGTTSIRFTFHSGPSVVAVSEIEVYNA